MTYEITITDSNGKAETCRVELPAAAPVSGKLVCSVNGEAVEVDAAASEREVLSLLLAGRSYEVRCDASTGNGECRIVVNDQAFTAEISDPRSLRSRRRKGASEEGPKKITAPMPGKVVRVLAPAGAEVEAGQGIIVIEAMKMQNELKSPKKGKVQKILAAEGATVNAGDTLAVVE